MPTANRVNANGVAATARQPRTKTPQATVHPAADTFRLCMTVALGVGIPLLSLAMSKLAGTLAAGRMYGLATFALVLMLAVLTVSLPHLSWSITNTTRSSDGASWALAIALDMSLVLCELINVYAGDLGLTWVTYAVMSCVALASMALNVWAFLMHDGRGEKWWRFWTK